MSKGQSVSNRRMRVSLEIPLLSLLPETEVLSTDNTNTGAETDDIQTSTHSHNSVLRQYKRVFDTSTKCICSVSTHVTRVTDHITVTIVDVTLFYAVKIDTRPKYTFTDII